MLYDAEGFSPDHFSAPKDIAVYLEIKYEQGWEFVQLLLMGGRLMFIFKAVAK